MRKGSIRTMAAVLSLSMALGLGAPAYTKDVQAATEHFNDASTESAAWQNWKSNWDAYSSNYENVSLTPGVNETQLNLAWYSKTVETPAVKIAKNADMEDAKEYTGTQESAVVINGTQYYSNKVTVTDLEENTKYYYQVMKNGDWTGTEEYSTKSFSGFSFLYVGDPQIGASKGQTSAENEKLNALNSVDTTAEQNLAARNDGYNWNKILNKAVKEHSDVSFMVSAGDQVNYAKNEREYAAYLGAEALASLPVATTIGNHDSSSNQYSLHYNNPNTFAADDTTYTEGKTAAGTDYYYTYGDVLFIVIDTNNYNCATHESVIKKAISENQDAKWRVVMFHQDIYGSGYDHSDSDGMVLRTQLTPIFDENKIDVVLQGHDHTYSRTFQLTGDGEEHTAYDNTNYKSDENFLEQNNCYIVKSDQASGTVVNPEGTVYLEANSATGSKFYNLITTQQDYIAERSQTWTPSYSVITVDENSFSMTAYDASTGRELGGSSTYTIVKDENAEKEDDAEAAKAAAEAAKAAAEEAQLALEKAKTAKAEAEAQAAKAAEKSANAEVAKMAAEAAKAAAAEAQEKAEEAQAKAETAKTAAEEAKAAATTEAEKAAAAQTATEAAKAATEAARVAAETAQAAAEAAQSAAEKAQAEAQAAAEAAKADRENAAKAEAAAKAEKEAAEAAKAAAEAAKAAAEAAAETAQAAAEKTVKATATPKKATLSKVTSTKKKQVKVTWKKDTKASGYQVVCAANKSFTKNVKRISVTKKTQTSLKINKLTSKKKVYVKVRSYKKVDGKKLYGKYSAVKSVKVK